MRLTPKLCVGLTLVLFALSAHATSVDPLDPNPRGNPGPGQAVQAPAVLIGDADGDGRVDGADYMVLKSNFGTTSGAGPSSGDFSGDGAVDWSDLRLFMEILNAPQETPTPLAAVPVPEPLTLGLFALGMVAAGHCWKRRTAANQSV